MLSFFKPVTETAEPPMTSELYLKAFIGTYAKKHAIKDLGQYIELNPDPLLVISKGIYNGNLVLSGKGFQIELQDNKLIALDIRTLEEVAKEEKRQIIFTNILAIISDLDNLAIDIPLPKQNVIDKIKSNYLFVSMQDISWIKRHLKQFPKHNGKTGEFSNVGVCSTVIFSGKNISGKENIRVSLFWNRHCGFVLNPEKINVLNGDIRACNSYGKIYPELLKNDAINSVDSPLGFKITIQQNSKYSQKKGYMRQGLDSKKRRGSVFTTNLACKDPQDSSIYHEKGSPHYYARAIQNIYLEHTAPNYQSKIKDRSFKQWDPYFTEDGLMKLNEAIAYQEGDENPIEGIIATHEVSTEEAAKLQVIMFENPCLQLYLYQPKAAEHIVRVMSNEDSLIFLSKKISFKEAFNKAEPFMGFANRSNLPHPLHSLNNILAGGIKSNASSRIYYNFDQDLIAEDYLENIKKTILACQPDINYARVIMNTSSYEKFGIYSFYLTFSQYEALSLCIKEDNINVNNINTNKTNLTHFAAEAEESDRKRFKRF